MAQIIQFPVDDTSPTILYLPFGDTFSAPNLAAGWNPYFSFSGFSNTPSETGNGTSYHVTSHNGSLMSLHWKGTGIQLLGYNTSQATYDIILDGSNRQFEPDINNQILATFQDLPDENHNISLVAQVSGPNGSIHFDQAIIIRNTSSDMSPAPNFTPKILEDHDIKYSGEWSFQNDTNGPFHVSVNQGDSAHATFRGASFLLYGITSPKSGNYSVTLDNVTAILSGESTFKKFDSLLFFTSDLDPNIDHYVEIDNLSGLELSLGNFTYFTANSSTSPPTPSPGPSPVGSISSPGSSASHQKPGTIAALVLAGVLIFCILTGLLFFFLVVRPRRRRNKQARLERKERRRKKREAGAVLDISPEAAPDIELGSVHASVQASLGHQSSVRSGFTRWKREVEGGLGSLGIGIAFRHSDSTNVPARQEPNPDIEPLSTKGSSLTTSSKPSSKRSKKKGKRTARGKHVSESSWSPSFALELPTRPSSSTDSDKGGDKYKDKEPEEHNSITSGLTPLSYMSATPSPVDDVHIAPPAYAAPGSDRHNLTPTPHIVPISISHPVPSPKNGRTGSERPLLNYGDPNPGSPSEDQGQGYDPFVSALAPPDARHRISLGTGEDQGSVQYSSDEMKSVLGSAAAQVALRGLSPRTESIEPSVRNERKRPQRRSLPPVPSGVSSAQTIRPRKADSPKKEEGQGQVPELKDNDRSLQIQTSDNFLSVRPTSPFEINFPSAGPSQHNRASTRVSASFVRFEDDAGETKPDKGKAKASDEQRPISIESPPKRSFFRLTPPSNPRISSKPSSHRRSESTSFLDFSSSSDASYRTHSIMTSDHSNHDHRSTHQQLTSRWSNTFTQTTDLSRSGTRATDVSRSGSSHTSFLPGSPASAPRSVFSGVSFPYPVSLPPSPHHPEGHKSPTSPVRPLPPSPEHVHTYNTSSVNVHPFVDVESPTDSIPMSVSELKFRRSDSAEESQSSGSSRLPPHPPLPGRETREGSDRDTPGPSTPNYLVQRHTPTTISESRSTPTFMLRNDSMTNQGTPR